MSVKVVAKMELAERTANPVDIYVGARVRMRRKFLNLSQSDLADALKLTFQQVQKYERGSNRISASKLYQIAKMLHVPIAYFFDGYDEAGVAEGFSEAGPEQSVHQFLMTPEGIELANTFPRIRSSKIRRHILEMVKALAETIPAEA